MAIVEDTNIQDPLTPLRRPPILTAYSGMVGRRMGLAVANPTADLEQGQAMPEPPSQVRHPSVTPSVRSWASSQMQVLPVTSPTTSFSIPSPAVSRAPSRAAAPSQPRRPRTFPVHTDSIQVIPSVQNTANTVHVTLCAADDTYSRYLHFRAVGFPMCTFSTDAILVHLVWGVAPFVGMSTGVFADTWYIRAVEPDWVQYRLSHQDATEPTIYLDVPIACVRLPWYWRVLVWFMGVHILLNSHRPNVGVGGHQDMPCIPDGADRQAAAMDMV